MDNEPHAFNGDDVPVFCKVVPTVVKI
ncbi:unnamed protein product [Linum tenue]|uniref:Uncharacterized protein n=1 Tax=Linum tenue TaxID=586396 RepID=A0AAV0LAH4_9ROSI|nr:unnamed protein product [Linum tenue]